MSSIVYVIAMRRPLERVRDFQTPAWISPNAIFGTGMLWIGFVMFQPDVVIHFAGLKAVGESVADPAYTIMLMLAALSTSWCNGAR